MPGFPELHISAGLRAALLLTALLLAACESAGDEGAGAAVGVTDRDAPPEVAALPPEVEIDDDPEQLIGLEPDGLYDLLGRPEIVRREPPAEIWQYRGATCVFDVVLYEEGEASRVTYVEARDTHGSAGEARACLNELLRSRLSAGAG